MKKGKSEYSAHWTKAKEFLAKRQSGGATSSSAAIALTGLGRVVDNLTVTSLLKSKLTVRDDQACLLPTKWLRKNIKARERRQTLSRKHKDAISPPYGLFECIVMV